jgi:7,8-dihydropterin-6-yl-methyl-4-(beta-D-ribofuranosyl)aminobenzene 5'-phosphate synthase
MFLISGFIPWETSYEVGLRRRIRYNKAVGAWEDDTLIADERFVMLKVKGIKSQVFFLQKLALSPRKLF